MAANISLTAFVKNPTARRKDPACGTCRKKCRKCDRKRPICDRCRSKGIHCEGYPPRFQFAEMVAVPAVKAPEDRKQSEPVPFPTTSLPVYQLLGESQSPSQSSDGPDTAASSLSPDFISSDYPALNAPSSSSAEPSPFSPNGADSIAHLVPFAEVHHDVTTHQDIIDHFDKFLSEHLIINIHGTENLFRKHVLPLAYRHRGVLHALLGLSACHMYISGKTDSRRSVTLSLQFRVSALHCLGSLLLKEEVSGLTSDEEEFVLGMALLLVLHDVCETGVSSHGAHLSGVAFLCKRLAQPENFATRSEAIKFFVSALAWLDLLRGFSGAEKMAYSPDVRECVRDHASISLHTLLGCPPEMFYRIGQVLESGKSYLAGNLSLQKFQTFLTQADNFFRTWEPHDSRYPTEHQEWRLLGEAYRHACLLRVMRFPDAFAVSCEDAQIQVSVTAILDVCAAIPTDSAFHKRLLFPLFLAGADASSAHQIHYASWRVGEIKHATGFQHPAMTELLTQVWEERRSNSRGWKNVPWMEFTCSELLRSQHAYLFF